jgi:heterodisulfide reductase subunit B2
MTVAYTYYPGCSTHSTGRAYDESIRAIAGPLGIELHELPDWNCCGATAYMSVNELLSFSLTARNLALAEAAGRTVTTPCSACYTNLRKTNVYLEQYPELREKVETALAEAELHYGGTVQTKHFLEVIARDVGLDELRRVSKAPLCGLKVAPYYGCQMLRPFGFEDDPENPQLFEQLLAAIGATPTNMALRTHCCGGSLMGTRNEVALRLCRNLLLSVKESGADCIAVTCPICQINLDAYQKRVNRAYGTDFAYPVFFFTQLIGLALDLAPADLGIKRCIISPRPVLQRPLPELPARTESSKEVRP